MLTGQITEEGKSYPGKTEEKLEQGLVGERYWEEGKHLNLVRLREKTGTHWVILVSEELW